MSIFGRLFGRRRPTEPTPASTDAVRHEPLRATSSDATLPEALSRHPTKADLRRRVEAAGCFRPESHRWIVDALFEKSGRPAVDAVVRHGTPVDASGLKMIGLRASRKVGVDFVSALDGVSFEVAVDRLTRLVHLANFRTAILLSLQGMEEAGIKEVEFSSAGDERTTPMERDLDGKRMSIGQARELVHRHEDQISRSVFLAKVDWLANLE